MVRVEYAHWGQSPGAVTGGPAPLGDERASCPHPRASPCALRDRAGLVRHARGRAHGTPSPDRHGLGPRLKRAAAPAAARLPPNPPDLAQDRVLLTVCDIVRWILIPAYPVKLCEAPCWFSPTFSSTVAARRPWIFTRAHSAQKSQWSCVIRMLPIRRPA